MEKIEGFERYLVSPAGKVYSLITNKYLRPRMVHNGYYQVVLCKSEKSYPKLIARLVAQAFIPNPDNKPEINHVDGNKTNNDISNLEWVTHSENIHHAFRTGLIKRSPNAGTPKIPINVYDYKTGEFKSTHSSLHAAARMHGISQGHISNVLAGRRNHTGGLTFTKT